MGDMSYGCRRSDSTEVEPQDGQQSRYANSGASDRRGEYNLRRNNFDLSIAPLGSREDRLAVFGHARLAIGANLDDAKF